MVTLGTGSAVNRPKGPSGLRHSTKSPTTCLRGGVLERHSTRFLQGGVESKPGGPPGQNHRLPYGFIRSR